MYLLTSTREKIQLKEIKSRLKEESGRLVVRTFGLNDPTDRWTRVANAFFGLQQRSARTSVNRTIAKEPPIGMFREKKSGLMRVVHKEIALRLTPSTKAKQRDKIFKKLGLELRSRNSFVPNQYIVKSKDPHCTGVELIELSNHCLELDEMVFATPNFVSEFRRETIPAISAAEWHLKNTGLDGQKKDEDVNAQGAWSITRGKSSITVAVLDDGIDVDHPNLKSQIKRNPDPSEPRDIVGRDFFIPDDDNPDYFNPRPKLFQLPYDEVDLNDIHGTPCAGVIAAAGKNGGSIGIAHKCKVLAVKIFHADNPAPDERVANAIRYACRHADIVSCSWLSAFSDDVALAINVDAAKARDKKGCAIFCAAGNDGGSGVVFPAKLPGAIAIGASTDKATIAGYSNTGPEIWNTAPSSGGVKGIFTTDVSIPNRGFNLGNAADGGVDGLHTNNFSGTSSATPLAAGVAALMLSVKPDLKRDQIREILADTAEKIGPASSYDASGHSQEFGFGRIDAQAAVTKAKAMA